MALALPSGRAAPRAPCPVGCRDARAARAAGLQGRTAWAAGAAGAAQAAGPPPHSAVRVVACYHPRGRVAQAAQAFGEALNNGSAGGVIAEMGLNPTGLGVEPFLRALQACPGLTPPCISSVPVLPPLSCGRCRRRPPRRRAWRRRRPQGGRRPGRRRPSPTPRRRTTPWTSPRGREV